MRDEAGRFDSEGRRLLLLALQHETGRSIAKRCGVRAATIGALATGQHRFPSVPLALDLEVACGIAVRDWKNAPGVPKSTLVDPVRTMIVKADDAADDRPEERAAE